MSNAWDDTTEALNAIAKVDNFYAWILANIEYAAPSALAGAVLGQVIWPNSPDSAFAILTSVGTLILVYNLSS